MACSMVSFVFRGKVQGVKLRRYVEAAGKYFGVGGYVINLESGDVFGEAWVEDGHQNHRLLSFERWIRGEHSPTVFTNIKPTPVGSAYPELARVEKYVIARDASVGGWDRDQCDRFAHFARFAMVRDNDEATKISLTRKQMQDILIDALETGHGTDTSLRAPLEIGSWPER